jgi:hypothetical protein
MNAQESVGRGAALLDEKFPGWRHKINVEKLYMGNGYECILGQLYGSDTQGIKELGLGDFTDKDDRAPDNPDWQNFWGTQRYYGFEAHFKGGVTYAKLKEVWIEEICKYY